MAGQIQQNPVDFLPVLKSRAISIDSIQLCETIRKHPVYNLWQSFITETDIKTLKNGKQQYYF